MMNLILFVNHAMKIALLALHKIVLNVKQDITLMVNYVKSVKLIVYHVHQLYVIHV